MLDTAMRLLSPTGYCMVQVSWGLLQCEGVAHWLVLWQGHRSCCPKTSQLYEDQLNKLHCPVVYTKDSVFVPSFREKYPLLKSIVHNAIIITFIVSKYNIQISLTHYKMAILQVAEEIELYLGTIFKRISVFKQLLCMYFSE